MQTWQIMLSLLAIGYIVGGVLTILYVLRDPARKKEVKKQ